MAKMSEVAVVTAAPADDIDAKTNKLIRNMSLVSAGVGLIPFPMVDMLAVGGLQVYLVREIALLYQVPFSRDRAKALISALVGSGAPVMLAGGAMSLVAAVPVIGQILSLAVMPTLSGASTFALGKVFNEHFKTGGTLLDFDADKMRAYYQQQFEKGKADLAKTASGEPMAA
ncbi:MAG: DUF697 domain-containing protein [Alphaproteobacteria bacterium]|nr:DUF697 domain-containing protein [Alphaproteobacteria bacterium]